MANYRSSFNSDNNNMQMEPYYASSSSTTRPPTDFRSYSDFYPPPSSPPPPEKLKKGKSIGGSSSKPWGLNDPELQRRKRIASYKAYSAEGKVKGSLTKSFRWLKDKYSKVLYGWW